MRIPDASQEWGDYNAASIECKGLHCHQFLAQNASQYIGALKTSYDDRLLDVFTIFLGMRQESQVVNYIASQIMKLLVT